MRYNGIMLKKLMTMGLLFQDLQVAQRVRIRSVASTGSSTKGQWPPCLQTGVRRWHGDGHGDGMVERTQTSCLKYQKMIGYIRRLLKHQDQSSSSRSLMSRKPDPKIEVVVAVAGR
jgi:hypothetical protein